VMSLFDTGSIIQCPVNSIPTSTRSLTFLEKIWSGEIIE
jgi:hypothetical protein